MFVLAVPDLERSGAFYRDVLGFKIQETGDPGWRLFVRDGCRIMAGECPDAMPAALLGDHSYFGYLVVMVFPQRLTACLMMFGNTIQLRIFGLG